MAIYTITIADELEEALQFWMDEGGFLFDANNMTKEEFLNRYLETTLEVQKDNLHRRKLSEIQTAKLERLNEIAKHDISTIDTLIQRGKQEGILKDAS